MAQGDIYRVTVFQTLLLQECLNVFFYQQSSVGGDGNDLTDAFEEDVRPSLLAVQVDDLVWSRIDTLNLNDGITFTSRAQISQTGMRLGSPATSFLAWGFRLARANALTRNGSKRLAGVAEEDFASNAPIGAMIPILQTAATQMAATIADAVGVGAYTPVIVKRPVIIGGVNIVNLIVSGTFTRLTSQVSRKESG